MEASRKSRLVATIMAFAGGGIGIDLFYKGKIGLGILQIASAVMAFIVMMIAVLLNFIPGIGMVLYLVLYSLAAVAHSVWPTVRAIMTVCGKSTDKEGKKISVWIHRDPPAAPETEISE